MKALLIVDIQLDFLPGGALGVKDGNRVIPIIDDLMEMPFDYIVASRDWHPENHGSFASTHHKKPGDTVMLKGIKQILWPKHCVQGTPGSEFSPMLKLEKVHDIFSKGTDVDIDSYSAFFDNGHLKATGLDEMLKKKNITDLFIVGLTTDYCVKYSVLDAVDLGYRVFVVKDACKPVNLREDDEDKALQEMEKVGAKIITSEDVASYL